MAKGPYAKFAALVLAAGTLLAAQPGNAGASAAAKGSDKDAAVKALKRQFGYLRDGQYDRAYAELHPSQQAIISQACYINSAQRDLSGVSAEIQAVKKVYRTSLEIPGTDETARGYGITVKEKDAKGGQSETDSVTYHEFKVGGHWKFTVTQMGVDQCAGT